MRYSYFICWENPIQDKKPSPSTCYTLSTVYSAAYKYQKGIYRRLLLLFGKPLTWLAYLYNLILIIVIP